MPSTVVEQRHNSHNQPHHLHTSSPNSKSTKTGRRNGDTIQANGHSHGVNGSFASTSALHEIINNPLKFDKSVMNPAQIKYKAINEPDEHTNSNGASSSNGHSLQRTSSTASSSSQQPSCPRLAQDTPADRNGQSASSPKKRQLFEGKIPLVWPNGTKNVGSGLHNRGNTCYMNSVMQSLVHTPPLTHLLFSHDTTVLKGKAGGELRGFDPVKAMQTFARRAAGNPANGGAAGQTSPIEFIKNLKSIAKTFSHGRQEDAHEWLRLLLDSMHQACIVQLSQKAKVSSPLRETTFIHRMFGGRLRSRVTCLSCQHNSDTFETMLDLSLDIRKSGNLREALDLFTEKDQLRGSEKYRCEKCKRLSNAVKYYRIAECPQVLTVHLKRFTFTGSKNNKPFAFPLQIKMGPSWLCSMSEENGDRKMSEPTYSLYAIVHHYGSGPHSGHYVAEVKGKDGRWYNMDDSDVSSTSQPGMASKSAYILFYVRNPGESLGRVMKGDYDRKANTTAVKNDNDDHSEPQGGADEEQTAAPSRQKSVSVKIANGKDTPSNGSQFSIKKPFNGTATNGESNSRFSSSNGPKATSLDRKPSTTSNVFAPISASQFHGKRKARDDEEEEDLGEGIKAASVGDDTVDAVADDLRGSGMSSPMPASDAEGTPQSRKAKRKLMKQQEKQAAALVRQQNGQEEEATSPAVPPRSSSNGHITNGSAVPEQPPSPHKKQKMGMANGSDAHTSSTSSDVAPPATTSTPPAPKPSSSPASSFPRSFSSFGMNLSPTKFGAGFIGGIAGRMRGKK